MATGLSILKPLGKSPFQHQHLCCRAQRGCNSSNAIRRRAELARENDHAGRRTSVDHLIGALADLACYTCDPLRISVTLRQTVVIVYENANM